MFHSAIVRLTLWYLSILLVISIIFSVVLYNISTREISYSLRSPIPGVVVAQLPFSDNDLHNEIDQFRSNRLQESRERIWVNLIYFNSVIALLGGWVSYLLARRTLRPIEEIMESQSRFTADASHELRTPLTAMRSEIEVVLRSTKTSTKELRELLQSNLEEVNKLAALSESLLKIARYQHQLPSASFAEVKVTDLMTALRKTLQKDLAAKQITIKEAISPLTVEADPTLISELLLILLDNAIKYSPAKTKIVVTAKEQNHDLIISVADQGSGINSEDLPHIFQRFYRADVSRSEAPGYGLGLAIAKQIVDLHQGRISVESTPGKNTTFTAILPIHQKRS